MRTTGSLHLGHMEGTLRNWVRLQDDHECFFFLADWHAFTDRLKIDNLSEIVRNMVIDWLSVGIDRSRSVIFRQSAIVQHAELCTIFGMFVPLGWLERCPTFKDDVRDEQTRERVSLGKLQYPVLMTADIALYNADTVPVGRDQLPHLELAREIIRRFNGHFEPIFTEPKDVLSEVPVLLGIDNRKMSKSYNNSIELRETTESLQQKVLSMITDPQRVRRNDPGNPEICTVFTWHKIYTPEKLAEIDQGCRTADIGCRDCKKILLQKLEEMLEQIRQRRSELEKQPDLVCEVLAAGEKRASEIASETMQRVRKAMGLTI